MILADTSVWIDHFRRANPVLAALLDGGHVLCHPFVIGELACGSLKEWRGTLQLLQTLESAPLADHNEVLMLVDRYNLMATGLGWLDAHLLGSTLLAGASLRTLDAPLAGAAKTLSVLARP
jgi:predicted nucleic acid-binding protein